MPWRIFMVCAHKEKKRTDKLESQKDLILNSTIIVQNLPPSDLELFIRNTNTNFIHHKKLLIFINSSWVNKEREWKCFSTVYLPWVVFLLSGKSEMEEKYICGFFPKTSFLLCLQEDLERSFLAYANYKIGFLTKEWRPEILERVYIMQDFSIEMYNCFRPSNHSLLSPRQVSMSNALYLTAIELSCKLIWVCIYQIPFPLGKITKQTFSFWR